MSDKAYTVKEITAVFYSQWHEPQEVSKYEERMFFDLVAALEDPNRCQCVGENGRLLNRCNECPR